MREFIPERDLPNDLRILAAATGSAVVRGIGYEYWRTSAGGERWYRKTVAAIDQRPIMGIPEADEC